MDTIAIIDKYRRMLGAADRPASFRSFAAALSAYTLPHDEIDKATIHTWCNGTKPNYWMLVFLAKQTQGWAADMARELLAALRPDVWNN